MEAFAKKQHVLRARGQPFAGTGAEAPQCRISHLSAAQRLRTRRTTGRRLCGHCAGHRYSG